MEKLIIFPYNGNAIEAAGCISNKYELIGFIDDNPDKQGINKYGHEIFSRDITKKYKDFKVLAVPGSPTTYLNKKEIIDTLDIPTSRFAVIIHPNASVSSIATIGYNTIIMAGVAVTSNAIIGNHVCILPNSVIHHDVVIGDYCSIGSNVSISGYTEISNNCYIGTGSSIMNNIHIGENTLIGIGSNVIRSLKGNIKAVGNPAHGIGNI